MNKYTVPVFCLFRCLLFFFSYSDIWIYHTKFTSSVMSITESLDYDTIITIMVKYSIVSKIHWSGVAMVLSPKDAPLLGLSNHFYESIWWITVSLEKSEGSAKWTLSCILSTWHLLTINKNKVMSILLFSPWKMVFLEKCDYIFFSFEFPLKQLL